jgi:nitrate reductase NapD
MNQELHISSLVVHIKPENAVQLTNSINALQEAELITVTPEGKAIVVIEANHQKQIMKCIDHINDLNGVLHTGLVYHEFEQAMQNNSEEIQ